MFLKKGEEIVEKNIDALLNSVQIGRGFFQDTLWKLPSNSLS